MAKVNLTVTLPKGTTFAKVKKPLKYKKDKLLTRLGSELHKAIMKEAWDAGWKSGPGSLLREEVSAPMVRRAIHKVVRKLKLEVAD